MKTDDHLKKIKRQVAMLEMIQEKHLRVMAEKVIMKQQCKVNEHSEQDDTNKKKQCRCW